MSTTTSFTRADLEAKTRQEILALVAPIWAADLPPSRYRTGALITRILNAQDETPVTSSVVSLESVEAAAEEAPAARKASSYSVSVGQDGESVVTFVVDGEFHTVQEADAAYSKVITALLSEGDPIAAQEAVAPPTVAEAVAPLAAAAEVEAVEEEDETVVRINGLPVDHALVKTLQRYAEEGRDPHNTLRFLDLLSENPSEVARGELFDWTKRQDLRIAEDGRFLGFKSFKVNADGSYRPHYTGPVWIRKPGEDEPTRYEANEVRIEVGDFVSMPREICDPSGADCSVGLHVGTHGYAYSYSGGVRAGHALTEVAVSPADVVNVPAYESTKLRTCLYEVLAIHAPEKQGDLGHHEPERTRFPEDPSIGADALGSAGVPDGFWKRLKAKLNPAKAAPVEDEG